MTRRTPKTSGDWRLRCPYTIAEMLNLRPPEMLVPQLGIPAVGYYELIGPQKSYKTTLALDLAMHMAAGFSSWNGLELPGRKLRVVWFAGESFTKLPGQVKRFLDYHKLAPSDLDTFMPYDGIPNVTSETQMREIFAEFNGMRIDVFFWDTLARSAFDWCAAFGAVSIVLRHAANGEERGKGDTQISNDDGDGQAYIWKDKTEGTVNLKPLEMRWAPDDDDLVRTWTISSVDVDGSNVPQLRPRDGNLEKAGERPAKSAEWVAVAKQVLDNAWTTDHKLHQLPMSTFTLASIAADCLDVDREEMRNFLRTHAWRAGMGLTEYAHKIKSYGRRHRCEAYAHPDWTAKQLSSAKW